MSQLQQAQYKSAVALNMDTSQQEQERDVLAVVDWNQKLAFYQVYIYLCLVLLA